MSQINFHGSKQCFRLYPYISILMILVMILLTGWQQGWGVTDQVNREVGLHKGWSMPLPPLSSLPCQTQFHLHLISISNDRGQTTGGGTELRHSGLVFHSALVVAPPFHFHCPVDTLGLEGGWDTWVGHQPVGWDGMGCPPLPLPPPFCILPHISLQHGSRQVHG